jgi:hypothetical protein
MKLEASKTLKDKKKNKDDGLSKNHSKSVRFRLRIQREKEATEEVKEFKNENNQRVD